MQEAERQTVALLSTPNVVLETDRKFVVNTYLALRSSGSSWPRLGPPTSAWPIA